MSVAVQNGTNIIEFVQKKSHGQSFAPIDPKLNQNGPTYMQISLI